MFIKSTTNCLAIACALSATIAVADQELERRASWRQPTFAEVKTQVDQWLASRPVDDAIRPQLEKLWTPAGIPAADGDLLDRVVATVGLVEPAARGLLDLCRTDEAPAVAPQFPLLQDSSAPPLVRHNLRLHYARWLAQRSLYDESLTQIRDLKPADVVDPATLLFYQSVGLHRLLEKEAFLATATKLLENKATIPRRYQVVGQLMEADLKPLKPDSLDEVSRLMDDIERRLGFGRAGKKVRQQEDDVVAKLDKMIEELEKQLQQQQSSGSSGGKQPSSPMQDSMPGGGSGPGEVDPKRTGSQSGWGNLPPKERQEALQQISKGLPAHYREVIEEYFRRLAKEGGESTP
jgi:hypothetical protein